MRQALTATLAVSCLAVSLSCSSNAPGEDGSPAVNAGRSSMTVEVPERPPQAAAGGRSDEEAAEAPQSAPGRLVVKFRDTLAEPADVVHRYGLRFAATARSGGAELDRLAAEYRVSEIAPVFSSLFSGAASAPGRSALADRRRKVLEKVKASRGRFAGRAGRVGPHAELPDLVRTYVLEVPADTDVARMARDFAANPNVEYAGPDHLARTQALTDDPYLQSSGAWGQPYGDLWALARIGAPAAWDVSTGGGVVVAVVDTGLDYGHPEIAANVWTNEAEAGGVPGFDDDGNGYVDDVRGWDFAYGDADPMDRAGHGTHVSGTIAAAGNDGVGVVGVAYQARIMPVKGLDDGGFGPFTTLAAAVTYAAMNGADVISNSWGCYGTSCTDAAVTDAIRLARSLGCVTTFAAGNNGADVKDAFPARLQDVITVAASGADDSKASFSNWGYLVDVAAPGGGPDAASPYAAFRNILSLRAAGTGDANLIVGGSYLRQAGTSMATPHVSGVAALLLAANPQLTVAQVESILRHTARDQVGDPSLDTAGYDPYYGWGRLDAAAAVARAFDPPADPPILKALADPLEFDVPAAMCAGQQWSLPVGIYNLGGGTLSWSAEAPDWVDVVSSSVTTPSFSSVTMTRVEDGTGVVTIRSPEDPAGSAALPVIARVATGVTISNCSTVLSRASGNQQWDPFHDISTRPPGVSDGAGGAFYVWTDTRFGNPDLFMQRVDGSGNPLWTADGMALTSAWPGAEVRPSIVADGTGGAIVAWVEGANTGNVYDKHIRAQRVSASGQKLWGPDGVWVCQALGGQERPVVISKGGGAAMVAWEDYRNGSADVYAQRIDAGGAVVWQADGVPVTRAGDAQFDVAMATDTYGGAIVTWVDRRNGYWTVYAQRLNAIGQALWIQDGLRLTPASSLTPGVPEIAFGPNVVPDGTGGVIVAWHDFRSFPFQAGVNLLSRSDVYATRLDAGGQSLWAAGGVPLMQGLTASPSTFVPGYSPSQIAMTSDGSGGAIVVWHDARSAVSWDVYSQRVDQDGNRLWGANGAPVSAAAGDQLAPSVAADGAGGAVYAWADARPGHHDVFVQRLGPTGAPLAPPNGVWVEGKPGDQTTPYVVPLAGGKFLVTWDDRGSCGPAGCPGTGIDLRGKVVAFGGAAGFPLAVSLSGDGAGTITSSPAGISCGATCSADFAPGTSVTLAAEAASGSVFTGWSGACTGSAPTCTVAMNGARMAAAGFTLVSYPLTVEVWGAGQGTVTGDGISCLVPWTAGCTAPFPNTTPPVTATITATAKAGSIFGGWTGCTTVSGNVCTVSMTGVKTVTATFHPAALLTVRTSGTGRGTVTGAGIACTTGSTVGCTATVPVTSPATSVTLAAAPDAASILSGWSGCTSVSGNLCTVSMTAAKTATATFQPKAWVLTARTSGTGRGTVTGEGLSCTTGSTAGCTASVPNTTPAAVVTLTAAPATGSIFSSWSGCTSVSGTACTVSMTGAKTVTATFQPATWLLTAKTAGTGRGTVTGDGISCATGSTAGCTASVPNTTPATVVTLTAAPEAGSIFTAWTGCTSVSGNVCTASMTMARTVTATFQPSAFLLTVNAAASGGTGTVTGPGIACTAGSTAGCSAPVANGATVTLTAAPAAGSILKTWSGCTTTSGATCTVTATSAKTVTATFQPSTYLLTVKPASTYGATGTIGGAGLACGDPAGCATSVANGSVATLTASPAPDALLKSWSGCTTTSGATCTVTMTSAKTVTATFQPSTFRLTVATAGTGSGTVTGPGISCTSGSTDGCAADESTGAAVTLTAAPGACATFTSWSGGCYGTASQCTVTMSLARSVTATFAAASCPLAAAKP